MSWNAGKILLDHFNKPLTVTYKSPNQRSPVTSADDASDAYLRAEILRRFPNHTVLSEENSTNQEPARSEITWVIDPLDGTNNFMNGLPLFGVSICVVAKGYPIAAAIFIPFYKSSTGSVFHARIGGGAKRDEIPLELGKGKKPGNNLLAAIPGYFWGRFNLTNEVKRNVGELRTTGSIVYEMAMISEGVFQYGVYNRPQIWDVAAGVLLLKEAGGLVLIQQPSSKEWMRFNHFFAHFEEEDFPGHTELKSWRVIIIAGTTAAVKFMTSGLKRRNPLIRRTWRQFKGLFRPSVQDIGGK